MTKIVVDQKKCLGCGTCAFLAPKTFRIGKNGKVEVINPSQDSQADLQNAIDSCPAKVISQKKA